MNELYRHDTPTIPGIRISEVRMAIRRKLTPAEQDQVDTKVTCPMCHGHQMVSPSVESWFARLPKPEHLTDDLAPPQIELDDEPPPEAA